MALLRSGPSPRLVYVQLSAERILLRRVATGQVVDDVPHIALDVSGIMLAFGRAADDTLRWRPDARVVNGFSHPRCVVDDMSVAAVTLRFFLEALLNPRGKRRLRRIRPDLVLHPANLRDLSGLEAWGLQRVGELAGARSVRIWLGEEPPYDSLVSGVPMGGSWVALPPPTRKRHA